MANEILIKSRTRITAQASGALTADYYPGDGTDYSGSSAGTCTTIDNTYDGGSENGQGAHFLNLELDVTAAPATAATADIYYRGSEDGGSTWTTWRYSHTVGSDIATSAARYDAGIFEMVYQDVQLAVAANDYGFTSSLAATPKLYEAQ